MKLDYFLYSCFEYEQTCKAIPGKATGAQRWQEVLAFLEGQKDNFRELGSLQRQLELSLRWYTEQFPALVTDRKIEMENISSICAATVMFCLDLRILAQADSLNSAEALQASDHNSLWDMIDSVVDGLVPSFSFYIRPYLRWVFVKKDEQTWDPGSRPPVGRYAPGAARRLARSGSETRGGNRRNTPGGPRANSTPKRDHDRGKTDERGTQKRLPPRNSHADQERTALEAVRAAVEKLRQEPKIGEVRLNPSNSFFRRLQHKMAVAEGFFSFSTGEGMQRSVVVTRDRQEHEDA